MSEHAFLPENETFGEHEMVGTTPQHPAADDQARSARLRETLGFDPDQEGEKIDPMKEGEELIDHLNIDELRNIFSEMRRRSGVPEDSLFVSKEDIQVTSTIGYAGLFSPDGKLSINPEIIMEEMINEGVIPTKAELRRRILSVLAHEETHASGRNIDKGNRVLYELLSYVSQKPQLSSANGYKKFVYVKGKAQPRFAIFSEGVTDLIGEEAYSTYLDRTGERASLLGSEENAAYKGSYMGARALTTTFIEVIANAADTPIDVVWQGLKQGYMSGLDLDDNELAKVIDEEFYPEFMRDVEHAYIDELELPLPEIVKRLKEKQLSAEAKEKIKRALLKYDDQLRIQREQSMSASRRVDEYHERFFN